LKKLLLKFILCNGIKFTTCGIVIDVPDKSVVDKPITEFIVLDDELAFIVNELTLDIVIFVVTGEYVIENPTGISVSKCAIKVFIL